VDGLKDKFEKYIIANRIHVAYTCD